MPQVSTLYAGMLLKFNGILEIASLFWELLLENVLINILVLK